MTTNGHRWPIWGPGGAKVRFPGESLVHVGSFWTPCLLKVGVFRGIFEGLTLDGYLVLLLVAQGSQNRCFLGWPTSTKHRI